MVDEYSALADYGEPPEPDPPDWVEVEEALTRALDGADDAARMAEDIGAKDLRVELEGIRNQLAAILKRYEEPDDGHDSPNTIDGRVI